MINARPARKALTIFLIILAASAVCCSPKAEPISIFVAAGAKPAVDEVSRQFEEKHGSMCKVDYGGGGEVLSRMILSRTGDVYIAPEQRFMETAREKGAIDPVTITGIAYMIPVIGVQKGNPKHIKALGDLAKPGIRIAITRPETTLLGKYAPEIFQKAGLYDTIEKNIVTQASRPDSLLTMLAMGQIDAGIMWHFYQTLAPDKIETIELSPEHLTGVGEMQIAVSMYCKDTKLAQQFISFATSAEGKAIFKKHGYIVEREEVKRYWR